MATNRENWIDVNQTAALLGIDHSTVYRHVHTGKLPFYRVGNRLRFDPAELRSALREQAPA